MTGWGRGWQLSEMVCQGHYTLSPSQCCTLKPPGVAPALSWAPPQVQLDPTTADRPWAVVLSPP